MAFSSRGLTLLVQSIATQSAELVELTGRSCHVVVRLGSSQKGTREKKIPYFELKSMNQVS